MERINDKQSDDLWLDGQKSLYEFYKPFDDFHNKGYSKDFLQEESISRRNSLFRTIIEDFPEYFPDYDEITDEYEKYRYVEQLRIYCDDTYYNLKNIKNGIRIAKVTTILGLIYTVPKIVDKTNATDEPQRYDVPFSIAVTTGNVLSIAKNDNKGDLIDDSTGYVNTVKTIKRYPQSLMLMRSIPAQMIFKYGRFDKDGHYSSKKTHENIWLSQGGFNKPCSGNDLDYFDLALYEAISTLYEEGSKDSDSVVEIDLDQVYRLMHHQTAYHKVELSRAYNKDREGSHYFTSFKKLCDHHVRIVDNPKGFNEDSILLNAEYRIDKKGKIFLIIHTEPILLKHAKARGEFDPIPISELLLADEIDNLSEGEDRFYYSENNITIYRYLIQRVQEIFGSIFMDDDHKLPQGNMNDHFEFTKLLNDCGFKDLSAAKRQTIELATKTILKKMKKNTVDRRQMITDFCFTKGVITLLRGQVPPSQRK